MNQTYTAGLNFLAGTARGPIAAAFPLRKKI